MYHASCPTELPAARSLNRMPFGHSHQAPKNSRVVQHSQSDDRNLTSARMHWRIRRAAVPQNVPWFGFDAVRQLSGLPPEILMVPLSGHTHGHAGVAVRRDGRWLLQTGDAYFWHEEMDVERPRCTPGLRMYQTLMEKDRRMRLGNQERLRELRRQHASEVEVFCSHDPIEYEHLSGHAMGLAVPIAHAVA